MSKFVFPTDNKSEQYCIEIASIMVEKFIITQEEAIGRINRMWDHTSFIGEYDMNYHNLPEEWAFDIYFGHDSSWWNKDISELEPIPYP